MTHKCLISTTYSYSCLVQKKTNAAAVRIGSQQSMPAHAQLIPLFRGWEQTGENSPLSENWEPSAAGRMDKTKYNNNIIIAFKGAIRDFFTISSQRRELSPTRTLKWPRRDRVQITCNTSSAYHVQHVVLRATWYEGIAQLLSLTELKSHLFELYFVSWIIKPMI